MRKVVLFALAAVLVMGLTFAAQQGTVELLQGSGVVTVGDPLVLTYTLSMGYEDVATRVVEVKGDKVEDNVIVMLLQDSSAGAVYQAKKEVYPTEQRTVYYISAAELKGTDVKLVAVMRDWNGKIVAQKELAVAWKQDNEVYTIELYPEAEGIYSVMAWVQLKDGTRLSMVEAGQLIALKKYMEAADWDWLTASKSGNYFLQVRTGVELLVAFDDDGKIAGTEGAQRETPPMHLGLYGVGQKGIPSIVWSIKGTQPGWGDLELVVNEVGASAADAYDNFTGYIRYKLYSEMDEGDCCSVTGEKWGVWLVVGTGQIHELYGTGWSKCAMSYHLIGISNVRSWSWIVQKGKISTGFLKAEIFLNTGDFLFTITPVIGTYTKEGGIFGSYEWGGSNDAEEGIYHSNLLEHIEFNLFVDMTFKKAITFHFGAWNDFEVIGVGVSTKIGSVELGGAIRYQNNEPTGGTPAATLLWAAHMRMLDITLGNFLPFDMFEKVSLGIFAQGSADDLEFNNLSIDNVDIFADLGAVIKSSCCEPVYPIKIAFRVGKKPSDDYTGSQQTLSDLDFELKAIWGQYNYSLGSVGPVSLTASLGAMYAFTSDVSVDNGPYGLGWFTGPALGVAWQVTGRVQW